MTSASMTPADFRPATLVALAEQCGWTPNHPVAFRPVVSKALALMGLKEDALGTNKATGQPQTSRNCQMAYKYAADNGLGVRGKRGQWGLNADGIDEARTHAETFGVKPPTTGAAAPATGAATPAPILHTTGVSVAMGRTSLVDAYHADPYIRSVAIAQTACFGRWSESASTCGKCPLSGPCRNMIAGRASLLATRLIQQANAPKAAPAAKGKVPSKAEGVSTAGVSQTMLDAFKDADEFINRTDATCVVCGKDIVPKAAALWADSIGTDPGGVAHIACGRPNG